MSSSTPGIIFTVVVRGVDHSLLLHRDGSAWVVSNRAGRRVHVVHGSYQGAPAPLSPRTTRATALSLAQAQVQALFDRLQP